MQSLRKHVSEEQLSIDLIHKHYHRYIATAKHNNYIKINLKSDNIFQLISVNPLSDILIEENNDVLTQTFTCI